MAPAPMQRYAFNTPQTWIDGPLHAGSTYSKNLRRIRRYFSSLPNAPCATCPYGWLLGRSKYCCGRLLRPFKPSWAVQCRTACLVVTCIIMQMDREDIAWVKSFPNRPLRVEVLAGNPCASNRSRISRSSTNMAAGGRIMSREISHPRC